MPNIVTNERLEIYLSPGSSLKNFSWLLGNTCTKMMKDKFKNHSQENDNGKSLSKWKNFIRQKGSIQLLQLSDIFGSELPKYQREKGDKLSYKPSCSKRNHTAIIQRSKVI